MVNIFATSTSPIKSAQSLDNKRIVRCAQEAYEVLSSYVLRSSINELKKFRKHVYHPHKGHQNHPAVNWILQDSLHFKWLLEHAAELNNQYTLRYSKEDCKPHKELYKTLKKVEKYLPDSKYSDYSQLTYAEILNDNRFRSQYSDKYEGDVILSPNVTTQTKYKLYLLHKWLYLDKRDTVWGGVLPPVWIFNPLYRDFLTKHFGDPKNDPVSMKLDSVTYISSITRAKNNNPLLLSVDQIGKQILKKFPDTKGSFVEKEGYFDSTAVNSCAVFDKTKKYRYFLSRQWNDVHPLVVCMLNPSTANAFKNDPTVSRIEALSRKMNRGGFIVLNFSAFRATEPKDMIKQDDPFGECNLEIIEFVLKQIIKRWRIKPTFILAYGNNIEKVEGGISYANKINRLGDKFSDLTCLKMTKRGYPSHPLYLSSDILPERYLPW